MSGRQGYEGHMIYDRERTPQRICPTVYQLSEYPLTLQLSYDQDGNVAWTVYLFGFATVLSGLWDRETPNEKSVSDYPFDFVTDIEAACRDFTERQPYQRPALAELSVESVRQQIIQAADLSPNQSLLERIKELTEREKKYAKQIALLQSEVNAANAELEKLEADQRP